MRFPDWRPRLHRYLAEAARKRFIYGKHDCALFAAGAVDAMTGFDPAADYRGRYATLLSSARVLRERGFGSHIEVFASLYADRPLMSAREGDLAVVGEEEALGVVQGAHIALLRHDGIGFAPLARAERAFEV